MEYHEWIAGHLKRIDSTVDEFGWAVQAVTSGPSDGMPSWSYTVGHEDRQRAELVIVGLPTDVAHGILNGVSDDADASGRWPEHGDVLHGLLLGGYEMRVVAIEEDVAQAGEWFNVALARRGTRSGFRAVQLVWPFPDYTWLDPHDERQPVLGTPWWSEQPNAA